VEKMESIADMTAELFIQKHFLNLDQKDGLVRVMRNSIRETVKDALVTYESQREQN
jgi:hypothetical protein